MDAQHYFINILIQDIIRQAQEELGPAKKSGEYSLY